MSRRVQAVEGSVGSQALHHVKFVSATTAASVAVAAGSCLFLVWALVSSSQAEILLWFEAAASALTLTMVFVLQHTQTRQELALQRKLDQILRAIPGADNGLISLEAGPEEALEAQDARYVAMRDQTGSSQ